MASIASTLTTIVVTLVSVTLTNAAPQAANPWTCTGQLCLYKNSATHHQLWHDIKYILVFGNSYSAGGTTNDLLHPAPPYQTSCNGPNYVSSLLTYFNTSAITPKSYAIPGSTISWKAIDPASTNTLDFEHQVGSFLQDNNNRAASGLSGISAANTLVIIEFGINDIVFAGDKYASVEGAIFTKYQQTIDKLHATGLRQFLFINVSPISRSPSASAQGTAAVWSTRVKSFNTALLSLSQRLGAGWPASSIYKLNINTLFNQALANPSGIVWTKGLKDLVHDCGAYSRANLPSKHYKSPECTYAADEYFWLSGYHPGYPVHDLMAAQVEAGLSTL